MTIPTRLVLAAAIFAVAAPVHAQAVDPARAPVEALSDGLITIMKGGKKLGFAGRAAAITPIIDRSFDIPLTARLVVGAPWLQASAADKAALIAALRRLTINQYAHNFDSWSGQAFTIDPKVEARGADRLVRTVLTQPKGETVKIGYRLRQSGGSWRIVDVLYQNSISQLTTRRADFESILTKGGARALISHVNALADKAAN